MSTLAELEERIGELSARREQNEAEKIAYDAEQKQAQLNADIALAEKFKPLGQLLKIRDALLNQKEEIDRDRALLERANRAEGLRQIIADFERAENEYRTRLEAENGRRQRFRRRNPLRRQRRKPLPAIPANPRWHSGRSNPASMLPSGRPIRS